MNENGYRAALRSDLPRVIRKDITVMSELVAKYRGIAAEFPDDKRAQEKCAEVCSRVHEMRLSLEGLNAQLMQPMGIGSGEAHEAVQQSARAEKSVEAALDVEDAIMEYQRKNPEKPAPQLAKLRRDIYELIHAEWPDRNEMLGVALVADDSATEAVVLVP